MFTFLQCVRLETSETFRANFGHDYPHCILIKKKFLRVKLSHKLNIPNLKNMLK